MIRLADARDVPAIRAIAHDAFAPYISRIGQPPSPMLQDYDALVLRGIVDVAELAGRVAGFIVLIEEPDHLFVDVVAVDPACRGLGIGRALLQSAETRTITLGLTEMRLYTNALMHESLALYLRAGWVETDRAEQDGYARVFMRKPVSQQKAV